MRPKSDELGNLFLFPVSGATVDDSDVAWRDVDAEHKHSRPTSGSFSAIDFETYYSNSYSLSKMSTWEYVTHHAFDAYLVAIERWDGSKWWRWVGSPTKAPWADIREDEWLSHNAGFDELVYRRLQTLGEAPKDVMPKRWHCTADLSIYHQAGRSLKMAVHNFFNVDISKEVREKMKGGNASSEEVRDYAAGDSFWCSRIWEDWGSKWPESEKVLSIQTRRQGWRGFYLNREESMSAIAHLETIKNQLRGELPWGSKGVVSSLKLFTLECGKHGIHAPMSLAEDSESAMRWEKMHGNRFPWIQKIKRYTKANQMQGSIAMMLERQRKDGSVPFAMMYCKATHTKRWQHAEGVRMQNLDKDPVEGINLRHQIKARPGKVFIIADLSQIEPRVLNWRAGNYAFLKLCAKGISPYEAHARSSMGYSLDKPMKVGDPKMYALAKARVLALGYQSGAEQFKEMAWSMAGLDISLSDKTMIINGHVVRMADLNSWLNNADAQSLNTYRTGEFDVLPSAMSVVQDFRQSSPEITGLWKRRQNEVKAKAGSFYKLTIPNGSALRYFDVKCREVRRWSRDGKPYTTDDITGWVIKDSKNPDDMKHLYGGKIVENEVQWISREVFADCCYRTTFLSDAFLLWTAHDEGIWEVPEKVAHQRLQDIQEIMKTPPWWATDLPIDSTAEITEHYLK